MKKALTVFVALVVFLVAGVAVFLATVDLGRYKAPLAEVLTKKTGHLVTLNGDIKFGLSRHGLTISLEDASFGNPSWASRPDLAHMGRFELGLSLMPLLERKIVFTELKIENADIQLETGAGNLHNWDMTPSGEKNKLKENVGAKTSAPPLTLSVGEGVISNSRLALRDKDGKLVQLQITDLVFHLEESGLNLHFSGAYNKTPIVLNVKTDLDDLKDGHLLPFDADFVYDDQYKVKAKGSVDRAAKTAEIGSYEVLAGKSDIQGQISARWEGAKPVVKGTLLSNSFNPSDFIPVTSKAEPAAPKSTAKAQRLFSDAPLGFDGLKEADLRLDFSLKELVVGKEPLKDLVGSLTVADSRLTLPLQVRIGGGSVKGQVNLNAAQSPAQFGVTFAAGGVDFADLLRLANAPSFIEGKAEAHINLASVGDSAHALASHMGGTMDVVGAAGEVSTQADGGLFTEIMKVITPSGGSYGLNCLAARFIVRDGIAKDNGLLMDTAAATIQGTGGFNLGEEKISLLLNTRSKLVNVAGLLPSLYVGGTFVKPAASVDPTAIAQNVMSLFTGVGGTSSVPEMQSQTGQNSCVWTLNHPKPASQPTLLPGLEGAAQKAKSLGNDLLKGWMGQ